MATSIKSAEILNFLRAHPMICIERLEKHLKIPKATISHPLRGLRKLPGKHVKKIEDELKKYGYKP